MPVSTARNTAACSRARPACTPREALERCWSEARGGHLCIAHVVGEAGLGKSRLVHEFLQRFEDDQRLVLQGHCSADGASTPFLPFAEVIRGAFRIADRDGHAESERKLRSGVEILGLGVDETVPYLLNLLGFHVEGREFGKGDSEVAGARTRTALRDVLSARCRLSPVLLFIDDLHWVDRASEALLA